MFSRLKTYLSGAKKEFKAISWPTSLETRQLTLIVIGLSLVFAAFLGAFDYLFTYILKLTLSLL